MDELDCTCGGTAILNHYNDQEDGRVSYYQCNKCGFRSGEHIGHWAEEGAASDWQFRMKHTRWAASDDDLKRIFKGK
jgi:hypothetical protein